VKTRFSVGIFSLRIFGGGFMATESYIRAQILQLFQTNPNIHMNVSLSRPKLVLENAPAKILSVYPHIFQIEECSCGAPKKHILQYSDILTRHIVITELEEG
jgi:uncharacterized protein Veg